MDLNNKAITMKNGKEYLVIEQVNFEGNTYVYLVNEDDYKDAMFRKVVPGENIELEEIESDLFEEEIYPLFAEKLAE